MPQAVSPRRPSGSVFPPLSPGQRNERKPKAPALKARTNPREWDPERVARWYMRHGPPATSPILAKIVLDNKIDGHALCDIPEDIFSELLEDRQLAEDMRATVHDLRARAGTNVSPTSRVPRAQDIAQSLASLSASPAPSLSASPEIAEEHEQPPSPHTPPPWDWSDDEDDHPHQYLGFAGAHTYVPFGSPSTAPHLLQPVVTLSPGAPYELSALMMPDAQGAADFAGVDAHEVSEHEAEAEAGAEAEAEGGADAVGSGDHPSLPQDQGDLPSRQDPEPSADADTQQQPEPGPSCAEVGTETPQQAPQPASQRPRLRLNSSLTSLSLRPGSCPPLLPLATYVAPRTPPLPPIPPAPPAPPAAQKTFVEEGVQACMEVPERVYASVAVQTRALAETAMQTEVEPKREDPDVVLPPVADHGPVESPVVAESSTLADETQGGSGDAGEPVDRTLASISAEPAEPAKPDSKATSVGETLAKEGDAPEQVASPEKVASPEEVVAPEKVNNTGETVEADSEPLSKSQRKKIRLRAAAAAALAEQPNPQDNDSTNAQGAEQLEAKQTPENRAAASEGETQKNGQATDDNKQAPPVPSKPEAAPTKDDSTQEPASESTSQEQSPPKPPAKDPKLRTLAKRSQSTLGGPGDNSWAKGATPPSLPAVTEVRRSVSGQLGESGPSGKRKLGMRDVMKGTESKKLDKGVVKGGEGTVEGAQSGGGGTEGAVKHDSQVRANDETTRDKTAASSASQKSQDTKSTTSPHDADAQDKTASDPPLQQDGQEVEDPVFRYWKLDLELADESTDPHKPKMSEGDQGQKASESATSGSGDHEHQHENQLDTPAPPAAAQSTQPPAGDNAQNNVSVSENRTSADRRPSTSSASESFVDASEALHIDAAANGMDTPSSGAHGAPPGLGQGTLTSSSEAENAPETVQEVPQVSKEAPAGDSNTGASVVDGGGASMRDGGQEVAKEVGGAGSGLKDKAGGENSVVSAGQEGHQQEALRRGEEFQDSPRRKPAQDVQGGDATDTHDVTSNPTNTTSSNERQSAPTTAAATSNAGNTQNTLKGAAAAPPAGRVETMPLRDTSKVLNVSGQNRPKTPLPENDGEHDLVLVSLDEGNEGPSGRNAVGNDGNPRDTDDRQHVQRPGAQRPKTQIVVPQRAVSASPVQQRQMQMQMCREPSDTRPSSTGGLQPQRVGALQPPAMQRSASPGAIYSPRPTQTGGLLSSMAIIAPAFTEFISGSGPATPVTPGEDGDAEEGFVELDEEVVDQTSKDEKEKDRKKQKKKRQAQKKKKNESGNLFTG